MDEPLPTRASLLKRLRDPKDHASWEEFHRTYRSLLAGVAGRAGLKPHEVEEAVQEILIAVARKLPEFEYRPGDDSFKGWLLQIARWKIADQFRKRRNLPESVGGETEATGENSTLAVSGMSLANCKRALAWEVSDQSQAFDQLWAAEWERHVLGQALAAVKRKAQPAQYAIYHLHVIEERTVSEVRKTLGVSTSQVYLAKHRVGRLVRHELRLLREEGP